VIATDGLQHHHQEKHNIRGGLNMFKFKEFLKNNKASIAKYAVGGVVGAGLLVVGYQGCNRLNTFMDTVVKQNSQMHQTMDEGFSNSAQKQDTTIMYQDSVLSAIRNIDSTINQVIDTCGAVRVIGTPTTYEIINDSLAYRRDLEGRVRDSVTNKDLIEHIKKSGSPEGYVLDTTTTKKQTPSSSSARNRTPSNSSSAPFTADNGYVFLTKDCEGCLPFSKDGKQYFVDTTSTQGRSALADLYAKGLLTDNPFQEAKVEFGTFTPSTRDLELGSKMVTDYK
jgi:hypothetical protein